MDKREESNAHPGWSVRFSDGTWLGGAHGWFRSEEAFYADIYDSEEEARNCLEQVKNDLYDKEYFSLDAEVVPAWQPLCERLRLDAHTLTASNKVNIFDLNMTVDDIQSQLNELKKMIKY